MSRQTLRPKMLAAAGTTAAQVLTTPPRTCTNFANCVPNPLTQHPEPGYIMHPLR